MSDVKLDPGWLTRDVALAAQRTIDWSSNKHQHEKQQQRDRLSSNKGEVRQNNGCESERDVEK